jgi:hypothetical protein
VRSLCVGVRKMSVGVKMHSSDTKLLVSVSSGFGNNNKNNNLYLILYVTQVLFSKE